MSCAIHTEDLAKSFDNLVAVNGINFDVNQGEVFGLPGPNGASKTTTIKMLYTLLILTRGKSEIDGYDVVKEADEVRKKIGVVPKCS